MSRRSVDDLDEADLASREALVAAVRELNRATGTTLLDGADLDEVTAAVAELTRVLGKETTDRVVRGSFLGPRERVMRGLPVLLHQLNPALPGVEVVVGHDDGPEAMAAALGEGSPDDLTATAELTMDSLFEGPRTRSTAAPSRSSWTACSACWCRSRGSPR